PYGIVYAIYIYNNFNDFQKHLTNTHSSDGSDTKTPISPSVGFLLVIIAVPLRLSLTTFELDNWVVYTMIVYSPILVLIFLKNKMLYEHLAEQGEIDRGSNGGEALLITIFTFGIGAIFVDWKFQNTLNKHLKRTAGFYA
ncbi:MAG: hypothetical protein ACTSYA_12235, partial [Candidatus Kariarchaeaceae archaeon]